MRSTFEEMVFQQKSVFRKVDVFGCFRRVVLGVSEEISARCKDFGLEP